MKSYTLSILALLVGGIMSCTQTNDSVHDNLMSQPVERGHQPEEKINFSHALHAKKIDCKTCHSKQGDTPSITTTVNSTICSSCHTYEVDSVTSPSTFNIEESDNNVDTE